MTCRVGKFGVKTPNLDHQANTETLQDILWILTVTGNTLMIYLKVTISKATFLLFQIIYRSVSWKMSPPPKKKNIHNLISETYRCYRIRKRVFANVMTKWKVPAWGATRVGPACHPCLWKRTAGGDLAPQRKRWCDHLGRDWSDNVATGPGKPAAFRRLLRKHQPWPCRHSDFSSMECISDFRRPKLWEN